MASIPIIILCPTKERSITRVQISPSHAGGAIEVSLGASLGQSLDEVQAKIKRSLR